MTARALSGLLFSVLCAAMFGLAAGAMWMVPTMYFGRTLPWLAIPIGWLLGLAIRKWLRGPGALSAGMAALATVLAASYTKCLVVAANIAGMMGMGFADAMHEAGAGMLLTLARMSLTVYEACIYLLAAILAAAVAWRAPRVKRTPADLVNRRSP
jgi:hypothetical protein